VSEITTNAATYIDTHCHYHSLLSFSDFFKAIVRNSRTVVQGRDVRLAICLTDMPGTNWFTELELSPATTLFSVSKIDDFTLSVRIGDDTVAVYCANQVNSQEKIEVIVVGFRGTIPEGLALNEYVEIYGKDYLLIFPWGVGKWLGRRGELMTTQMDTAINPFVLGDNGGRPYWWSRIPQFSIANKKGIPVLAGSDPLPVSSFQRRVASFGNVYDEEFGCCSEWIKYAKGLRQSPSVFGAPSGTLSFLAEQFGLRIQKILKN